MFESIEDSGLFDPTNRFFGLFKLGLYVDFDSGSRALSGKSVVSKVTGKYTRSGNRDSNCQISPSRVQKVLPVGTVHGAESRRIRPTGPWTPVVIPSRSLYHTRGALSEVSLRSL